jgi:hypothetical protein
MMSQCLAYLEFDNGTRLFCVNDAGHLNEHDVDSVDADLWHEAQS